MPGQYTLPNSTLQFKELNGIIMKCVMCLVENVERT